MSHKTKDEFLETAAEARIEKAPKVTSQVLESIWQELNHQIAMVEFNSHDIDGILQW